MPLTGEWKSITEKTESLTIKKPRQGFKRGMFSPFTSVSPYEENLY